MSDEASIEFDGIEEACYSIRDAPKAAIPPALVHCLTDGGAVVQSAIASRTPDKTGELLADLDTVVTLDEDQMGGEAETGFSEAQGRVARWLELGHREIGHRPLEKDEGRVAPHPFIRPAAEAAEEEAIETLMNVLMDDLSNAGIVDAE